MLQHGEREIPSRTDLELRMVRLDGWSTAAKAETLTQNLFTPLHREPWFRDDNPEKLYLKADKPGARVTVEIETRKGTIKIYHLKSKWYGLGSISCWADDDTSRAVRADGWWDHGDLNIGR